MNQYPHSPEAYGTPVGSPPPNYPPHQQQQQQQYFHQQPPHQQPNMNQPQQPDMAYHQQQPMHDEKQHSHAYPNGQASKFGNSWNFGFWDCCSPFSTACFTCWCPCVVFGKTYDREHGDPNSNGLGMMCCAWYCAAMVGFSSCVQCIIRGQFREKHKIDSNMFNDFLAGCCCPCCALLQEEKESLARTAGIDPVTKQAYQSPNGMHYGA